MPKRDVGVLAPGAVLRGRYPFVREIFTEYDEDGPCERATWRPGVNMQPAHCRDTDDTLAVAHGVGEIILTVVSLHKPGKYQGRVFFTRQWKPPNGPVFGKGTLRTTTEKSFCRMAKGYRFYFDVQKSEIDEAIEARRSSTARALIAQESPVHG